jgi:hypothetical protein
MWAGIVEDLQKVRGSERGDAGCPYGWRPCPSAATRSSPGRPPETMTGHRVRLGPARAQAWPVLRSAPLSGSDRVRGRCSAAAQYDRNRMTAIAAAAGRPGRTKCRPAGSDSRAVGGLIRSGTSDRPRRLVAHDLCARNDCSLRSSSFTSASRRLRSSGVGEETFRAREAISTRSVPPSARFVSTKTVHRASVINLPPLSRGP